MGLSELSEACEHFIIENFESVAACRSPLDREKPPEPYDSIFLASMIQHPAHPCARLRCSTFYPLRTIIAVR